MTGEFYQIIEELISEYLINPFFKAGHGYGINEHPAFAFHREPYFRMGKRIMRHQPGNVSQLCIIGPKEFSSGRDIVEEVADRYFRALIPGSRFYRAHDAA